ncbi:MAG: DNA polymerase Y family protein [Acidobacteria bacterium]|nr:DNA polymerase Y family protein [Acidobacteriota bacterium]MDA1234788.1 DNA polymerase Y family protein [Acidobacteriota bacterium]
MRKLYACLRVKDFAVAVVLRGQRSQPAVVFSGAGPNVYVYQANGAACATGIRAGMTLSQAQGRSPQQILAAEPRSEQAEHQAQRELLEAAQLVSPRVEDREPGLLIVDLAGVPDAHSAAAKLVRYAAQLGLSANAATSQNRFAATAATQLETGVTHIYPGEAVGFLQHLPVFALPLLTEEKRILKLWGIRTVGEFTRLSADSLTARFGDRGARLAKLARGDDDSLFAAWEAPHEFEESVDFDWQVADLDPLSFLLAEPLRKVCKKLRSLGSAAEAISLDFKLSDGSRATRSVALSHPLTDPDVLLKLIRLELSAHPTGKAVEALTLAAKPVPRRELQHDLFSLARPSPEKLAITIGRLKELMGMENVGAPAARDTHEPRVFSTRPFHPGGAKQQQIVSALGFRCYRPSIEAEVTEESNQPAHVRSRIVDGRVRRCAGPWRVNGDWWLEEGWDLAEWDVELSKGLYRLSCILHSQTWRLVGVYD